MEKDFIISRRGEKFFKKYTKKKLRSKMQRPEVLSINHNGVNGYEAVMASESSVQLFVKVSI